MQANWSVVFPHPRNGPWGRGGRGGTARKCTGILLHNFNVGNGVNVMGHSRVFEWERHIDC